MKHLTRIRLINWHLFDNTTIRCQGTTYFIGINGAGKSTILDAVQFALVGGQREVRFNQAALSGGKRTLSSYVRGELGTEGQRFLRRDATGVVALEFRNPDGTYFAHGAVVDAYEDGRSPDVAYFIVHNAALNDAWFFRAPGQVFDTRAFKRHLEGFVLPPTARAQVFPRLEDYRLHLLNRLGQLKDSFLGKIVKGLAFSPLTDIRSFVHNYLLDEALVDVRTLQTQLETLRHFEGLAANVRERIAALERIDELDRERIANRRRRITNGYVARRAQADAHLARLKELRLQLDEVRLELNRAGLQQEERAGRLRRAEAALVDAQVALQMNGTAARDRELRQAIAGLEAELAPLLRRQAETAAELAAERRDAERLQQLLQVDGFPAPAALGAFLQAGDSPSQPLLAGLGASLERLGRELSARVALLDERARQARDEEAVLQREIRQLQTGDRETGYQAESPQAVKLRRLLRAGLGLGQDQAIFLADALHIPDPSWQDAVEGILGHNRFTLLVPAEHYDAAMRLYRERRQADGLHGVGLLDGERLLAHAAGAGQARPDSLATEVETGHPVARAFVNLALGGTVKCDTLEDLRQHRTAVTRECFVRRNFATTHLNPQVYRHWFIGERSAGRQIERRRTRLDEIAHELVANQEESAKLGERLALTRDKTRRLIGLEHALAALERIPALKQQMAALWVELAALDLGAVESLRAVVEQCTAEREWAQADLSEMERKIGHLESRAQTLADEIIPALEREAGEALDRAQQFLTTELPSEGSGEEALAATVEAEREYERRLERQPLETILLHATKYEGDYASAEARSRDRLREDKQRYSLRYDFGYDEQEDAGRYRAERDKLVRSELPQYESRIAEQRALAEQELVENFIHRLREQIEEARQQLAYLNSTLAQLRFGGERFEFIAHPAPALREVYEMIMDSQYVLGDSLFESAFRQKHQQGWDLLFERLSAQGSAGEAVLPELRELQDYRNYLEYDIRIHYPNGDRALLSQINAKKSGGETTTPFYVAMAASFAQAYRLNQPRPSDAIRLALFDEAFGKMDTARTASALQFMRDTGLQVLLATPPDKSGSLLPYVDTVCTVVRKDHHAFVIEIDKAEMLAEFEQVQAEPA